MVFGNRGWTVYPGKVRNGKDWEAFKSEHSGKVICIQSEYEDAVGAANAVTSHPIAMELLDGMDFQRVMQWDWMGLKCGAGIPGERGGFDAITPLSAANHRIVDLKITTSTDPAELQRHVLRMQWHCQACWYQQGAEALGYPPNVPFYLVCVEAQPPHCVTVLHMGEDVLEHGRKQVHLWAERLLACDRSAHWPGYVQTIQTMVLPEWMEDAGVD
jgi:hypothetical protein